MNKIVLIVALIFISNVAIAQNSIKEIVEETSIVVDNPKHMDPVSIGAVLVDSNKKGEKILILKADIMQGYHIYAYVPSGTAYINSEFGIELQKGAQLVGNWTKSSPQPYPGKQNILVYKNENTFYHSIKINPSEKGSKITCWLYYQCCDANICFPPQKKEIEITL